MRTWVGRAFFYLGADVASRILPFFVLPFLAKEMGAAEFGRYAILLTLVNTFSIFVGFSTHSAVNIAYFKENSSWRSLAENLFSFWSVFVFFFLLVSLPFMGSWAGRMFAVGILAAYCTWVFQLTIVIVHFREKIIAYAVLQLIRALLLAGLPLLAVLNDYHFAEKIFQSFALAHFILLGICLLFLLKSDVRLGFSGLNWKKIKQAHAFSIPIVVNGAGGWLRTSFDRYILVLLGSAAALGVYSLGFQLGSVLGVAGLSLSKVSSNYVLKFLAVDDVLITDRLHSAKKVFLFFVFLNLLFLILFLVAIYFSFHIFFGKEYESAYWVAVLIAVAFFMQSYSSLLTPFFQYPSKHALLGKIAVLLSALSAAIVCFSINYWSYMGAAGSFLLIWVLQAVAMTFLLKKNIKTWFAS